MVLRSRLGGCLGVCGGVVTAIPAAPPPEMKAEIVGHVLRPAQVDATEERVRQLDVAPGFRIEKYAEDLGHARMLAIGPDGSLYVTRPKQGDVLRLIDADGDGRAEERRTALDGTPDVHGIAFHDGRCYLATVTEVLECEVEGDGTFSTPRVVVDDLPDGGQHPNRTLAFGPDGLMYLSVGSTCNACDETNPEHATMLRLRPDTWERQVFARGLRNTIGFGWHPETGELWGMDHGIDWLGDDGNREELNRIVRGADYGWPYIYEDGKHNPAVQPQGTTYEALAATTEPPALTYTAHAAPMQMAFLDGEGFPEEMRGDAVVAMRGSWNRSRPSGYEVVRIRFEDGEPAAFEPLVSGFLVEGGSAHFGRLAGVAASPDGAIYVSDDTNGVVYRIWHEGGGG